jgi:plasmid stabilization system protein ParE
VKSVPVVALDLVQGEVQAAYDYFEAHSRGAGERFLDNYFKTADQIAQNAETFPLKFDDYRRALVPRSNLAIYYFMETNRAVIVAVIDARRHPSLIRRLVRQRRAN